MANLRFTGFLLIFATFFLKISSMLRDMFIAYYFGTTEITDAYLSSFLAANMLILFMVTGMKDTFVPSYISAKDKGKESEHITSVFKGTFIIGLIASIIGIILSPILLPAIYPNFSDNAHDVLVWTAGIYFGTIVFVGLNAVLEGYLDAVNRFSWSVFSQTIVVLFTIGGIVILAKPVGIYGAAIGYIAGTLISLCVKYLALLPKKLITLKNKTDWEDVKRFYKVFLPIGITVAIGQVSLLIDSFFANRFGEGVLSYLNYAFRVVQFPQQIFGVTVGTVVLPILARAAAKNDNDMFKNGIEKGLSTIFYILLPSLIGMLYLMPQIIEILYERGEFNEASTLATSKVGIYYLGTILFFSLHMVITKAFYSIQKGHYILYVGLASIFFKVLFNFIFSEWFGYIGLALSSSVVAFLYVGSCFVILVNIIGGLPMRKLGLEFLKVIIATTIMYSAIYFAGNYIEVMFSSYLFTLIIIVIGVITYALASFLIKCEPLLTFIKK
ncbi:murein biosynthesis integral membrane protein MurJ [Bacillus salitolerans]|uniref:Lipid II flippase n=1 Tax=Bacillus salitolerans TaxID=1437434 RepID=A0ABW4LLA5_9BACI